MAWYVWILSFFFFFVDFFIIGGRGMGKINGGRRRADVFVFSVSSSFSLHEKDTGQTRPLSTTKTLTTKSKLTRTPNKKQQK